MVAAFIGAAVLFGIGVWAVLGAEKAEEYFAGYLLEQSLSVDNLFVFILVFKYFKTPRLDQEKVRSSLASGHSICINLLDVLQVIRNRVMTAGQLIIHHLACLCSTATCAVLTEVIDICTGSVLWHSKRGSVTACHDPAWCRAD